jgi:hypothetical protein
MQGPGMVEDPRTKEPLSVSRIETVAFDEEEIE